jgi:hypothetical protein
MKMDTAMTRRLITVLLMLGAFSGVCLAVPPAFPGAEGGGMYSVGGRGGVVYEVTNLNDSGPGSFREACAASGPRIVVFRVSGTIQALSRISILNAYITIAGQTAPGDGICIRGYELMIRTHDVICRYLRVRRGVLGGDSIDIMYGADKVIIDHCTAMWGTDENLSCYGNTNVTVQWCMVGEGLYDHSCGGLWGPNTSYHHNLIFSNGTRNAKLAYGSAGAVWDFRNNVVYNWGYESTNGDVVGNLNTVNNYYEYGPGTRPGSIQYKITSGGGWNVYAAGNYVWGYPAITADNWAGGIQGTYVRYYEPFAAAAITMQPAEIAKQYVVGSAGCSYPRRDSTDLRFLGQMRTRTYSFAGLKNGTLYPGIPDATTVLDWPTLNSTPAPIDSDHDGMPDAWEDAHGLNKTNAADRNYYTLDPNYTNLEVYLNSLCPDPYAPSPNPMAFANAPYAASTTSIAMSATPASDPYGVEYYFKCTSGGGHDSGWQAATSYTDTGLAPMTTYAYTVKARSTSANHNVTMESPAASVSTNTPPDHEAPAPDPMTWATPPKATGISTITMTASAAADRSGVQYFFANITDPNHNSGWQEGPSYTDTGLTNNTNYVYRVTARDMSVFSNETGPSADANAVTMRYLCTTQVGSDLNGDCRVDFADFAALASIWGAAPTIEDILTNGAFDTSISDWQFLPPIVTEGVAAASFDPASGNPAGSALITADTTAAALNSSRFYQIMPVTPGRQYRLAGDWQGSIKGTVGTVTNARNWVEVYVTFVPDGLTTPTSWGSIMYKKAFGVANMNIAASGAWAWEPITASCPGNSGPADGVFTATDDYMVVAFNLGGRIGSGQTWLSIDNISMVDANPCTVVDMNNDCGLDFLDVQQFASDYLSCNRDPATECW